MFLYSKNLWNCNKVFEIFIFNEKIFLVIQIFQKCKWTRWKSSLKKTKSLITQCRRRHSALSLKQTFFDQKNFRRFQKSLTVKCFCNSKIILEFEMEFFPQSHVFAINWLWASHKKCIWTSRLNFLVLVFLSLLLQVTRRRTFSFNVLSLCHLHSFFQPQQVKTQSCLNLVKRPVVCAKRQQKQLIRKSQQRLCGREVEVGRGEICENLKHLEIGV